MPNGGLEHWMEEAENEAAASGLDDLSSNKLAAALSRYQTRQIREMFAEQTRTLLGPAPAEGGLRATVKDKGPWAGLSALLGGVIVYIVDSFLRR